MIEVVTIKGLFVVVVTTLPVVEGFDEGLEVGLVVGLLVVIVDGKVVTEPVLVRRVVLVVTLEEVGVTGPGVCVVGFGIVVGTLVTLIPVPEVVAGISECAGVVAPITIIGVTDVLGVIVVIGVTNADPETIEGTVVVPAVGDGALVAGDDGTFGTIEVDIPTGIEEDGMVGAVT